MKFILLSLLLVSQTALACFECDNTSDPLLSYKEPTWEKSEIPDSKDGGVLAVFDLSKDGHPINVRILLLTPQNLDKAKVKRSIELATFSLDNLVCMKGDEEKDKGVMRHFKFNYNN